MWSAIVATNLWTRFRRLIADKPTVIVTVTTVNSDGTSLVTTAAGGSMRVLGTSVAVGSKAFVRDGAIIGEAPDLPYYELEA